MSRFFTVPLHDICSTLYVMYVQTPSQLNMKLLIADIIGSQTAAYQDEGQQVYTLLEQAMCTKNPFDLSFERLDTCSTRFLNASIGRLYRVFPANEITSLMTISGIDPDDFILREMIRRSIDKALNPGVYTQLKEKTLASA